MYIVEEQPNVSELFQCVDINGFDDRLPLSTVCFDGGTIRCPVRYIYHSGLCKVHTLEVCFLTA